MGSGVGRALGLGGMAPGRWALLALLAATTGATTARAEPSSVVLLPTTARTSPLPASRPRRDVEEQNARLEEAAREMDLVLSEAVQDLGLTLDLAGQPDLAAAPTEEELVARAEATWVIAPEVAPERGALVVRIVAVAPGSKVVLSRQERVETTSLESRRCACSGTSWTRGEAARARAPRRRRRPPLRRPWCAPAPRAGPCSPST